MLMLCYPLFSLSAVSWAILRFQIFALMKTIAINFAGHEKDIEILTFMCHQGSGTQIIKSQLKK